MLLKQRIKSLMPAPLLEMRDYFVRARQAAKTPEQVFSEVYQKKSWGGEEHDFFSGYGSHATEYVDAYVAALRPILIDHPSATVVDLGCGDFNIGSQIRPLCRNYIACDVVPDLIERNKKKFADAKVDFRCLDITKDAVPAGDIILVRQVLQHLNNKQIARFLKGLGECGILVLTEHLPKGSFVANRDKPTGGGIRLHGAIPSGVVLDDAPFYLKYDKMSVLATVAEEGGRLETTAYYRPHVVA
jgi:SAM-dependent methyltransferase